MSLYFFHFLEGTERSDDDTGVECASVEMAYLEAFKAAEAMWSELLAARADPRRCAFEIAHQGSVLMRLDFSELLENCNRTDGSLPWGKHGLADAIANTHQRACVAKKDLEASFAEVRQSLDDASELLSRLDAFAPCGRSAER